MKNEEEKNQLLVELLYIYHFYISESLILEHYHCEKFFKNIYSIKKYSLKFITDWSRKTSKNSKKQSLFKSIRQTSKAISFDGVNIFWKFFHSDNVLRLKIHQQKNDKYTTILPEVDFFLLRFSFSFSKLFRKIFIS